MDEGALRRSPGLPGAMAQQLWHLLKANELPHVSVRALPLGVGPHRASASGAFTILEFPSSETEKGEPPTIYSESLTGALYLDKPREIQRYEEVWSALAELALGEEESNKMITAIIGEMHSNE